ncbi:acetylcholine receptor subunit beta-like [Ruditapes philippinarum]|uniref:acetylcholine receptor subunit beta-like n=1 Tax=Ruditapes philippinarum TaxID=129788 RepID=UPI00295BF8A8|nr:acetylcholine receptor subunit beta-like [Ruditapes philippinarum]
MKGRFNSIIYIYIINVFLCSTSFVRCATINDTESLLANIQANYNKNVRPTYDQSQAIQVNIVMYLKSIQEFDEVQKKFSFVGAMGVVWHDYKMQWDPYQYGGLWVTTLSYNDIWVPELVLSSPSGKGVSVGKSTDVLRITNYGTVYWYPSDLFQSTCSVNVRYYPFDIQKCTTSFASLGYKKYEVNLTHGQETVDFSAYSENGLWRVDGSETKTQLLGDGEEMEISFTVHLSRKAAYVVVNLLMPTVVLSLMNAWVFILVPESGERIGYTITTLLAIAVYMTIVSDTLPKTSEPVPLISYKLMADLVTSALTVFVTILNARMHLRSDTEMVPNWLQRLYNSLRCVSCCKTERIVPEDESAGHFKTEDNMKGLRTDKDGIKNPDNEAFVMEQSHNDKTVTWKSISNMIDWISLIGFSFFSLLSFFIFIGITSSSK